MCSGKRSIGPTSTRDTVTCEVPNMGNKEPNDPSLALCQICANRGDVTAYAKDMDGVLRQYPTCMRYTFNNCNDFVPANIRRH